MGKLVQITPMTIEEVDWLFNRRGISLQAGLINADDEILRLCLTILARNTRDQRAAKSKETKEKNDEATPTGR